MSSIYISGEGPDPDQDQERVKYKVQEPRDTGLDSVQNHDLQNLEQDLAQDLVLTKDEAPQSQSQELDDKVSQYKVQDTAPHHTQDPSQVQVQDPSQDQVQDPSQDQVQDPGQDQVEDQNHDSLQEYYSHPVQHCVQESVHDIIHDLVQGNAIYHGHDGQDHDQNCVENPVQDLVQDIFHELVEETCEYHVQNCLQDQEKVPVQDTFYDLLENSSDHLGQGPIINEVEDRINQPAKHLVQDLSDNSVQDMDTDRVQDLVQGLTPDPEEESDLDEVPSVNQLQELNQDSLMKKLSEVQEAMTQILDKDNDENQEENQEENPDENQDENQEETQEKNKNESQKEIQDVLLNLDDQRKNQEIQDIVQRKLDPINIEKVRKQENMNKPDKQSCFKQLIPEENSEILQNTYLEPSLTPNPDIMHVCTCLPETPGAGPTPDDDPTISNECDCVAKDLKSLCQDGISGSQERNQSSEFTIEDPNLLSLTDRLNTIESSQQKPPYCKEEPPYCMEEPPYSKEESPYCKEEPTYCKEVQAESSDQGTYFENSKVNQDETRIEPFSEFKNDKLDKEEVVRTNSGSTNTSTDTGDTGSTVIWNEKLKPSLEDSFSSIPSEDWNEDYAKLSETSSPSSNDMDDMPEHETSVDDSPDHSDGSIPEENDDSNDFSEDRKNGEINESRIDYPKDSAIEFTSEDLNLTFDEGCVDYELVLKSIPEELLDEISEDSSEQEQENLQEQDTSLSYKEKRTEQGDEKNLTNKAETDLESPEHEGKNFERARENKEQEKEEQEQEQWGSEQNNENILDLESTNMLKLEGEVKSTEIQEVYAEGKQGNQEQEHENILEQRHEHSLEQDLKNSIEQDQMECLDQEQEMNSEQDQKKGLKHKQERIAELEQIKCLEKKQEQENNLEQKQVESSEYETSKTLKEEHQKIDKQEREKCSDEEQEQDDFSDLEQEKVESLEREQENNVEQELEDSSEQDQKKSSKLDKEQSSKLDQEQSSKQDQELSSKQKQENNVEQELLEIIVKQELEKRSEQELENSFEHEMKECLERELEQNIEQEQENNLEKELCKSSEQEQEESLKQEQQNNMEREQVDCSDLEQERGSEQEQKSIDDQESVESLEPEQENIAEQELVDCLEQEKENSLDKEQENIAEQKLLDCLEQENSLDQEQENIAEQEPGNCLEPEQEMSPDQEPENIAEQEQAKIKNSPEEPETYIDQKHVNSSEEELGNISKAQDNLEQDLESETGVEQKQQKMLVQKQERGFEQKYHKSKNSSTEIDKNEIKQKKSVSFEEEVECIGYINSDSSDDTNEEGLNQKDENEVNKQVIKDEDLLEKYDLDDKAVDQRGSKHELEETDADSNDSKKEVGKGKAKVDGYDATDVKTCRSVKSDDQDEINSEISDDNKSVSSEDEDISNTLKDPKANCQILEGSEQSAHKVINPESIIHNLKLELEDIYVKAEMNYDKKACDDTDRDAKKHPDNSIETMAMENKHFQDEDFEEINEDNNAIAEDHPDEKDDETEYNAFKNGLFTDTKATYHDHSPNKTNDSEVDKPEKFENDFDLEVSSPDMDCKTDNSGVETNCFKSENPEPIENNVYVDKKSFKSNGAEVDVPDISNIEEVTADIETNLNTRKNVHEAEISPVINVAMNSVPTDPDINIPVEIEQVKELKHKNGKTKKSKFIPGHKRDRSVSINTKSNYNMISQENQTKVLLNDILKKLNKD